jgi:4'-phosphopantetheinyl transferase
MVDLWTIPLDVTCPVVLSADEEERAARFRFEADRVRWTRAHSWLRSILARYTDATTFTYGEHGKPALPGVEFNLSHAGEFAMIAVTTDAPVGIDIERIRPEIDIAKLLSRLGEQDLPVTTEELYARWTRREAMSKAVGGQLFMAPPEGVQSVEVKAPTGYAASVAVMGFAPVIRYCEIP